MKWITLPWLNLKIVCSMRTVVSEHHINCFPSICKRKKMQKKIEKKIISHLWLFDFVVVLNNVLPKLFRPLKVKDSKWLIIFSKPEVGFIYTFVFFYTKITASYLSRQVGILLSYSFSQNFKICCVTFNKRHLLLLSLQRYSKMTNELITMLATHNRAAVHARLFPSSV